MLCAQAELQLAQGLHEKAGALLAKARVPFDEAALQLLGINTATSKTMFSPAVVAGEMDLADLSLGNSLSLPLVNGPSLSALRVFLTESLNLLPANAKSQRTMLCTWLCEVLLHQITCSALFPPVATGSGTTNVTTPNNLAQRHASAMFESDLMDLFRSFLRTHK